MEEFLLFRALLLSLYPNISPTNFDNNLSPEATYDFVVVGAGAAGSVVAGRLAEADATVLVLEAGPSASTSPEAAVPAAAGHLTKSDRMRKNPTFINKYHSELKGNLSVAEIMGGGTTLNGMVYLKGARADFDNWANLGNEGWDYMSVLPYYKKLERFTGNSLESKGTEYLYGRHGHVELQNRSLSRETFEGYLKEIAIDLGYNFIDPSEPEKIGFSLTHMNCKNGQRQSSSESFLKPVVNRKNILIKPNSVVKRILFDNNQRAIGVEYISEGMTKKVYASKEIVLSAGALDTPKLLMLSGVGPRDHLQQLGINVIADVPGVGKNLKDHPYIKPLFWNKTKIHLPDLREEYVKQHLIEYNETFSGPLSDTRLPIGHVFANVNDRDHPSWPDVFLALMSNEDIFAIHTMLSRPKSSGEILLNSSDFYDNSIIKLNFLDLSDDIDTLVAGIKLAIKIGNNDKSKQFWGLEDFKANRTGCSSHLPDSPEFWSCYVKRHVDDYNHPAGSCKMSPATDPMGVVTPRLRLRSVEGIRIADASIMPQIVSINPMNTIMMIGEKAADMIKQDWKLPPYDNKYIYLDEIIQLPTEIRN